MQESGREGATSRGGGARARARRGTFVRARRTVTSQKQTKPARSPPTAQGGFKFAVPEGHEGGAWNPEEIEAYNR